MRSLNGRASSGGRKLAPWTAAVVAVALVGGGPLPARAHDDEHVLKFTRGRIEKVSLPSKGATPDKKGDGPLSCEGTSTLSASDDGRFVTFASTLALTASDANGSLLTDVFVRDRKKGKTELVSAMDRGTSPPVPDTLRSVKGCHHWSIYPAISADGRWIAFVSKGLVDTDADTSASPLYNVYLRDLKKNATRLVTRGVDGAPALGASGLYGLDISRGGRKIVFTSSATNLTKDTCAQTDVLCPRVQRVYVYDRVKRTTKLVSRSRDGSPASATAPQISDNGSVVTFQAPPSEIDRAGDELGLPVDTTSAQKPNCALWGYHGSSCTDVYLVDLRRRKTELISVDRDGGVSNAQSQNPWFDDQGISSDGRYVTFESWATDLVPSTRSPHGDGYAYVHDRKTGRTERVGVSSMGTEMLFTHLSGSSISNDGRYVHMLSGLCGRAGWDPPCHDGGMASQVIYDRKTGQADAVHRLRGLTGSRDDVDSAQMTMTGDGRRLVWKTWFDPSDPKPSEVFLSTLCRVGTGIGPLGSGAEAGARTGGSVCIARHSCLPPGGRRFWRAPHRTGGATVPGAELYGASLAFRPELGDVFAAIEAERLGTGLLYGLRFQLRGAEYEVRATGLPGAAFGLFDCTTAAPRCTQVASLEGGYGTTGDRVVVSLPLEELGLQQGGRLRDVEAFSALGTYLGGPTKMLDLVSID